MQVAGVRPRLEALVAVIGRHADHVELAVTDTALRADPLGERADRALIRSGSDSCSVEAVFDVSRSRRREEALPPGP